MTRVIAFLVFMMATATQAAEPSLEIVGAVAMPGPVTQAALAALPAKTVMVAQATAKGESRGTYTGPALWDVLSQAKVIDPGKNGLLQRTVTVTARDGYTLVMSLSEINPDYGANDALIAVGKEGTSLKPGEGYRLVVPRDRRASRSVRDVVKIEVK